MAYTWKIEGNKVEWCTEFPRNMRESSPQFTIRGYKCWFYLDNSDVFAPAEDSTVFYGIRMGQSKDKKYQPFPITVYAGFMCDENFKFPHMTNDHYNESQYIWFIRRRDVWRNLRKNGMNRNFLKFVFVFEETLDQIPSLKKRKEEKSVQVDLSLPRLNLENMSQDWSEFLRSSDYSDVQLKCKDCVLQAHRVVLAARSKVFNAMFKANMRESRTGVVNMTDVDGSTVDSFLEYIYSGKIQNLPAKTMCILYSLGDKYAVDSLRKMCAISMIENLSRENCSEYLQLSILHNDGYLREALMDCITNNFLDSSNQSNRDDVIGSLKESFGLLKIEN